MKISKRFFGHNSAPRVSQKVKLCLLGDFDMLDRTVEAPGPQVPQKIAKIIKKLLEGGAPNAPILLEIE